MSSWLATNEQSTGDPATSPEVGAAQDQPVEVAVEPDSVAAAGALHTNLAARVPHVAIIVGSTRPGRKALVVAEWVHRVAGGRIDATFEIVDLADYDLPLLDEPRAAAMGPTYRHDHTKAWSAAIAGFDGFIFVTPEYNHSTAGVLKNAIDFLFDEWNDKAAGFVSYGLQGGTRAVEHLRLVVAELKIADVRTQVALSLHADFDQGELHPSPHQDQTLARMLDELVAWSGALEPLRAARDQPPTSVPTSSSPIR